MGCHFEGIAPPAKRLTESGLVKTGRGKIRHIRVEPLGAAGTVIIYDNTAGSGTTLFSIVTEADYEAKEVPVNKDAWTGIYVVLTNCVVVVDYL